MSADWFNVVLIDRIEIYMKEKIAVIGSNSFSGSHFVNHCLDEGLDVKGISRSSEPDKVFLPYKNNKNIRDFVFHQLDLNNDLAAIMRLLKEFEPDYVVNFAAQGMVAQSWERPGDWFRTNTLSNVLFHDELRKCGFLKRYVHISTPEVYGNCEGRITENTSYNPSTPYAVSRAATDMSLMSFCRAYNFPVVFTRAANVYGPGQQLYRIIPITILKFMAGEKLELHGGGTSVRSFIHIKDVANGTLKAARLGKPGDIFHFSCDNNFVSIRELVEKIAGILKVDFEKNVAIVGERLGKDSAYILDSGKAARELGWKPEITMEQGLKETLDWVCGNFDKLKSFPWKYMHKS